MLVDSDLPRPAVHAVFDLPLELGLCDALRGDYDLAELVGDSILPNLSVLPAGIADARSARAMNSKQLPAVIEQLRDQFDYVIVDSSPLLPVADRASSAGMSTARSAACCEMSAACRWCAKRPNCSKPSTSDSSVPSSPINKIASTSPTASPPKNAKP